MNTQSAVCHSAGCRPGQDVGLARVERGKVLWILSIKPQEQRMAPPRVEGCMTDISTCLGWQAIVAKGGWHDLHIPRKIG